MQVHAAKFQLAGQEFDGYIDDQNNTYLSSLQVAASTDNHIDTVSEKRMSSDLKSMLGVGFTISETKFKMASGGTTSVKLWKSEYVAIYWIYQAIRNNKKAQAYIIACATETLERRILGAHNIKLSEQELEVRTAARYQQILTRNNLTDSIKAYINNHSEELSANAKQWMYKHVTDKLYKLLFGKTAATIRKENNLSSDANLREIMSARDMLRIEKVEDLAAMYIIDDNIAPTNAIELAVSTLRYNPLKMDYSKERV